LASCSAPWQAGPNKSMRYVAIVPIGVTIFVAAHASYSHQADTIVSLLSWQTSHFRK